MFACFKSCREASDSDSSAKLQYKIDKAFLVEADGTKIAHSFSDFTNWGETVHTKPSITFYPRTKFGVGNIVTWAKQLGKRVRVSGYKHTWTQVFVEDDQIHIALLSKEVSSSLPAIHPPIDDKNELQQIELIGDEFKEDGKVKHLCKMGPAVTNEQFRKWAIKAFESKQKAWTLPLNVVMTENTIGGTNANMCHGAGIGNHTISDLVTEIEFVNPKGELQTIGYKITDPLDKQTEGRALIKTAAGSFGMLGVVTSITFKLDEMSHARMVPRKLPIGVAIPPPDDFKLPEDLRKKFFDGVSLEQLALAKKYFIARCKNYYEEEFWFPFDSEVWTNSWNNDGDPAKSRDYPGDCDRKTQEVEEYLSGLANKSIMRVIEPKEQTKFLSNAAMFLLPDKEEITTPLIDGIHFRSGIQNMRVQDMEFEIPIPADKNGEPDWSICQRAWWDAIVTFYEWAERGKFPMRMPIEMRIMGDSNMTMAPQRGNKFGTCSIEVLTIEAGLVDPKEWLAFMQDITDKWAKYTDANGNPLNIRPHPAKQWKDLTIQRTGEKRMAMEDYIRNVAYKEPINEFNANLIKIAEKGKYDVKELSMFSNSLLDRLIYGIKPKSELAEKKSISPSTVSKTEEKIYSPRSANAHLHTLFKKAVDSHQDKKAKVLDKDKKPETLKISI